MESNYIKKIDIKKKRRYNNGHNMLEIVDRGYGPLLAEELKKREDNSGLSAFLQKISRFSRLIFL